jgi:hypothetical protein
MEEELRLSGRISCKIRVGFLISLNNSRTMRSRRKFKSSNPETRIEHHCKINRGILPLNNASELLRYLEFAFESVHSAKWDKHTLKLSEQLNNITITKGISPLLTNTPK